MRKLSAQRRKVVVLAGSVICLSAVAPILIGKHHILGIFWIAGTIAALVFVIVEFGKLKRGSEG